MAEAPQAESGGEVSGVLILLVLIVFLVLWLRGGGWAKLKDHPINFGWQPAAEGSGLPFSPNFENLAPKVPIPTGPQGPSGPQQ